MIKIADLKNNLSRHLASVRQGGQITVLDRDTPVARIIPFNRADPGEGDAAADPAAAERTADLARQGIVTPGDPAAASAWLASHPPLRLPRKTRGAVETLLEMRGESSR